MVFRKACSGVIALTLPVDGVFLVKALRCLEYVVGFRV